MYKHHLHTLFLIYFEFAGYTMYNIYVTNQAEENVYFRLRRETIRVFTAASEFVSRVEELSKGQQESQANSSSLNSYLISMHFCIIPPQTTMSFTIGPVDDSSTMWASLYARSKLWIMDYKVDYVNFGCLFVKQTSSLGAFYLIQANPEPVWISAKKGDAVPDGIVKTGSSATNGFEYYVGRSILAIPCPVASMNGQCNSWIPGESENEESGELLRDTGYQWIRASRGDPIPPNSVIVGVRGAEGSVFLGRVGREPCSIITENGKIKDFCYFPLGEETRVANGEVIVLTNGILSLK